MPENQRPQSSKSLRTLTQEFLSQKPAKVLGRIVNSSNATLLVEMGDSEGEIRRAIYKPLAGERPLWDFPPGLYRREVAAYLLSEALELHMVPVTIERKDLEYGIGSLQEFIDADFSKTYYEILEDEGTHERLIELAAFDIVANNSDRKGGHILIDESKHIYAIDNGLCFHEEFKLRTVIWEFGDAPIPTRFLDSLDRVVNEGFGFLRNYLSEAELSSLESRARFILHRGSLLDLPEEERPYPWPII
ncbi:conserved hypothetical protein [Ferrithrix thermotolerans DSM 19514]|uniref:PI3K/PI4K catalytic domain-containing protein n=1 Tax=Ferrithrix thermotolerans DSM 19514 TaxID=1121881 RepID=A0A1M4U3K3_9ACTN|nr:SCO1664 family protein [Ferrithrix thermotolerans]SHE51223.1 conserved hypothetical protein [Ferrithrix thermotolerans DSM 19514]